MHRGPWSKGSRFTARPARSTDPPPRGRSTERASTTWRTFSAGEMDQRDRPVDRRRGRFRHTLDRTLLAYAEGWLLVYYLMQTPVRLPQFQAYLKTISKRTDKNHRYDDAEKHFGDLERLDQDLGARRSGSSESGHTVIDLAPPPSGATMSDIKTIVRAGVFRCRARRAGHLHYLDARLERTARTRADRARRLCDGHRREPVPPPGDRVKRTLSECSEPGEETRQADPREALKWAECARRLDPSRDEAWDLIVALNWDLGDYDGAIARCGGSGRPFSAVSCRAESGSSSATQADRGESPKAEHARQESEVKGWLCPGRASAGERAATPR